MKTIFKYTLFITDEQEVPMLTGAHVLSAQMQGDQLCLWALVDTDVIESTKRTVRIFGTGRPVNIEGNWQFVGTVQEGPFVWHVFIEAQ